MNYLQLTSYRRLGLSIGLGLLSVLMAITTIYAQKPGDLDTTFNNTGIVTTTFGSPWEWGLGVAVQSDDKIVVVGERMGDNGLSFIVLRYTVTGTLDSTFNITNSGFITTSIGDSDSASSVVIQPDGKIVVAGYSGIGIDDGYPPPPSRFNRAFAVARYTISGTLDTTFNDTGIVTTPISSDDITYGNSGEIVSVALQPQGEIVVAGYTGNSGQDGSRDFAVVRYTPTGTLDSTFNHTGIVTTPIGNSDDQARAVAIQSDGKIVVAGYSENNADKTDFAIVRYTPTGTLDSIFNHNGIVTTPISNGDDSISSIAIQPDGNIVVVGSKDYWSLGGYIELARYTITGSLDTTFNQTGIVTTSIGPKQVGHGMALQSDGKIVVAGSSENDAGDVDFTVIRYTTAGVLDTTFNNIGIITTPIGSSHNDEATAVAIPSDDKIVVAGIDGEDSGQNIVVVRYLNRWYTYLPVVLKD